MSGLVQPHWLAVGAYLVAVNFAAFVMFGWDKRCARRSRQRIPEARLLMVAAIGGTPGAKAGQRWFRHKTYKQPFRRYLNVIMFLQISLLSLLVWMIFQAPSHGAAMSAETGLP